MNVPAGTKYGTTSGYNYPDAALVSTFSGGTGCLYGGAWSAYPLVLNGEINSDTVYVPVCSCTGQTYTIKLAVKNNIDMTQPNQQFYNFNVESYDYTLIAGNSTIPGSTSISGNFTPTTYREVTLNNIQAFSEISIDSITIKYDSNTEETLTVNGGAGMYGHVATAYLYKNGTQYGQAPNINQIPFASTQNGIALTIVITKDIMFGNSSAPNNETEGSEETE